MANFRERVADYRPSKMVWFWSSAGLAAITVALGFTWGGWVTGGTAQAMAEERAEDQVALLAASVCVDRFMSSPEARTNLIALNEESTYARRGFVEDGGWATFAEDEDPVDGAADLCADRLAEMEVPPEPELPVAELAPADQPTTNGEDSAPDAPVADVEGAGSDAQAPEPDVTPDAG